MRARRNAARSLALVAALVVAAAACSSGSSGNASKAATPTTGGDVPSGGTLVMAMEQEPDCADWIGSCAGASWGTWAMNVTTMARPYSVEESGDSWDYKATSLLTGPATVATTPKQVITYNINPKAIWSDGTPITSHDFKYTWEQVATAKSIYDRTGYTQIESVDDSKPETAVVTYKEPFADWRSAFGGNYGVLPAHLLEGKDRNAEMANGYSWSAGPWKIESWQKGSQVTLVPNDKYWGTKPKLAKVVFKIIADTSAEFQAFKAGEVLGMYPQPQLDAVDQITNGLADANSEYTDQTGNSEGLWMNNGKPPFDDINFRKAIAYSIDRDAIVNRLFGKIGVKKALQTVTAPILKKYATLDAFSAYKLDLGKVDEFMKKSGWAKGSDGIWAKGGQRATFEIKSTTQNKRRELTEQILQQQFKTAGFEMTINNQKSGDLFGDILPKGDFQMGLYANVLTSFYPSNCNLFCAKNIPTQATNFSGNNWYRVNDPAIDAAFAPVETTLDSAKAAEFNKKGDKLLADNMHFLPLDPLPDILLTSKRIVGPVQDNPIMGPFWHMYGWGLKK